jgi:hypothetical protein
MAWNTPFTEFPAEDQLEWYRCAMAWYNAHKAHIETLISEGTESFYPSGSDCGKPELWKPGHWRWFFKLGDK